METILYNAQSGLFDYKLAEMAINLSSVWGMIIGRVVITHDPNFAYSVNRADNNQNINYIQLNPLSELGFGMEHARLVGQEANLNSQGGENNMTENKPDYTLSKQNQKKVQNQLTMGDLISALQDVTNDDHLVAMAFGDLKGRGVVKMNERAAVQAWLEAPEHLRNT
jgi:hypothetical protein